MKMTFLLFCVIILNDTRFFSTSFVVHCCLVWCVGVPQSFLRSIMNVMPIYWNHSSQKKISKTQLKAPVRDQKCQSEIRSVLPYTHHNECSFVLLSPLSKKWSLPVQCQRWGVCFIRIVGQIRTFGHGTRPVWCDRKDMEKGFPKTCDGKTLPSLLGCKGSVRGRQSSSTRSPSCTSFSKAYPTRPIRKVTASNPK